MIFRFFFLLERMFFKGIHRKNKNMKTLFASILIPSCVFFKNKNIISCKHRIQFITKTMIFRKIKKSCNTKTLWKQNRNFKVFCISIKNSPTILHQKVWLNLVKITKNHGNDQFGGSFEHCVRCVLRWTYFCTSLKIRPALWESTRRDKTYQKTRKPTK